MSHTSIGIRFALLAAAGLCVLVQLGCGRRYEIQTYTVPKPDRMLGAVIRHGDRAWFFKVTGPNADLAEQEPKFRQLIRSVRFVDEQDLSVVEKKEPKPEWDLPEGWRQLPDDAPQNRGTVRRYATLEIPLKVKPLEVSVTPLALPDAEWDEALLQNINRWRGQLSLSSIEADELKNTTEQIKLADATATLVNLVGTQMPDGLPRAAAAPAERGPPSLDLTYDTPEGWEPGELVISRGGITIRRQAAFNVLDDDQEVEVTVTALPTVRGDLLANVNRWRVQIGLREPLSSEQLESILEDIEVAGVSGKYVELIGRANAQPQQAILGAIVENDGLVWFFKLQGDLELAQREKEQFLSFVESVKFQ